MKVSPVQRACVKPHQTEHPSLQSSGDKDLKAAPSHFPDGRVGPRWPVADIFSFLRDWVGRPSLQSKSHLKVSF